MGQHQRWMRGLGFVLAAITVAACSSGGGAETTILAESTSPVPTSTSSPATTVAPSTSTTTLGTTTTAAEPTTTTTTLPDLPDPKTEFEHGGTAWAVFLAAGGPDDATLADAVDVLDDLGYVSWPGDLWCDWGGYELLGLDSSEGLMAVGVYFDTEVDAMAFVVGLDARGIGVAGWGLVETYCLD